MKYAKFYIGLAGVLAVAAKALADGSIDSGEIAEFIGACLIALGIRQVPNAG